MADRSAQRQPPSIAASPLLRLAPPAARHILRAAPSLLVAAGDALDLPLSMPVCRASVQGHRSALWLGPDERLLLADAAAAADSAATLRATLGDQPHSLVDVSHRQVALIIEGPHAATALAAGCPLDLDATAFPIGMCTRTVLAKAEIVLWRIAGERFHLEVWRSFAAYVSGVIAEAARGLLPRG
jgi:sarcosine oxidase subunit gamma